MTNKMLVTATAPRNEEFEAHGEFAMKTMLYLIQLSVWEQNQITKNLSPLIHF